MRILKLLRFNAERTLKFNENLCELWKSNHIKTPVPIKIGTGRASKESKAPFGVNLKTFLVDPIYLLYFDYVRFKRTTRIGADGLFCAYLRTNLL